MHIVLVDELINFKDILGTIEAGFGKNLRTTEARLDFTGPYKKKSVFDEAMEKKPLIDLPRGR